MTEKMCEILRLSPGVSKMSALSSSENNSPSGCAEDYEEVNVAICKARASRRENQSGDDEAFVFGEDEDLGWKAGIFNDFVLFLAFDRVPTGENGGQNRMLIFPNAWPQYPTPEINNDLNNVPARPRITPLAIAIFLII
jgi:hypothetical protein